MARPLRIAYNGAWYHIMNRGLERRNIFLNDHNRQTFLNLLNEISDYYQVEIHGYCLMGNHYHLLLKTPLGNISRAMRHLDGVYTQRFNRSTKRDGPLFRGRFKSKLVEAESYLLQLSRYIHLNPIDTKMVSDAILYRWSSYAAYLGRVEAPKWLIQAEIRRFFDDADFYKQYRMFVNKGNNKGFKEHLTRENTGPILGCDAFIENITEKYLNPYHQIPEIPEHKLLLNNPPIHEIITAVAVYYGVSRVRILSVKKRGGNLPRTIAIYLSRRLGQLKSSEIAETFEGIGASGISKSCRRLEIDLEKNMKLISDIKKISANLRC